MNNSGKLPDASKKQPEGLVLYRSTVYLAALSVLALTACTTPGLQGPDESEIPSETSNSRGEEDSGNQDANQSENLTPANSAEDYRIEEWPNEIAPIPEEFPQLEKAGFSHYTSVFGIPVIGTEDVTEETMLHVRGVLAGYLDNDQDGIADNPKVVSALLNGRGKAAAAVFDTFDEYELFDERDGYDQARPFELITMMQEETNNPDYFDASLEEVLHMVTQLGYAPAYPEKMGENSGTLLNDATEEAIEKGYFFYEDPSCDSRCLNTEFIYWVITSNMGLQESRCRDIEQEWKLCSPEKLRESGLSVLNLIDDPELRIPAEAPKLD